MRKERGKIVVMCHGMNAQCPNHADEYDYVQNGYYCRRCIDFHASLPKSWTSSTTPEQEPSP